MSKLKLSAVSLLVLAVVISSYFYQHQQSEDEIIYALDMSSVSSSLPYGNLNSIKSRFIQDSKNLKSPENFSAKEFDQSILTYNQKVAQATTPIQDPIDAYLSVLPDSYRRHFTLIHRSYSIQKATPMAPRVILFGRDAQVMMTFNGGKDENGTEQDGGNTIEVIQWNTDKKIWEFSEISFNENKTAHLVKNPAKCVMCHAGTPKPVDYTDIEKYHGQLKPIFPQYPFWPGFYGSVNDVVGIEEPKSKDTITRNLPATIKQIKDLTFDSTEELYRLRELLDKPNSQYLKVVENELNVHLKHFQPFIESTKKRLRYRHLVQMTDSYLARGEKIPEALRSAPYRRTFDIEYGHYMLRPNFYLTTLLASYQAQFIAEQIAKHPVFPYLKYSLLYKKYNCGQLSGEGITNEEINDSLDLLYPNQSSEAARNKQYLLAYQYNVVQSQKGGPTALPLHSWNLESNEDIASYHYGNVYADLNELVLWTLLTKALPDVALESGREAAEKRHYELVGSSYFKDALIFAKSYVSRFTKEQMGLMSSYQTYADSNKKFKALPSSIYCDGEPQFDDRKKLVGYKNSLKLLVQNELKNLAELKSRNQLPHQVYKLDPRLYTEAEIKSASNYNIHLVRQACESCHDNGSQDEHKKINPPINVNWSTPHYAQTLKSNYTSINPAKRNLTTLHQNILSALDENELPVPFGQRMPYGRKPMDQFSVQCELFIMQRQAQASQPLKYVDIFQCGINYPQADPNSIGCRCFKLVNTKHKLYLEFYKQSKAKQ